MLPLQYFKLSDIYTCNLETLVLGFVLKIFFFLIAHLVQGTVSQKGNEGGKILHTRILLIGKYHRTNFIGSHLHFMKNQ